MPRLRGAKDHDGARRVSWRITRIYLIIGSVWILFSDQVTEFFVTDTSAFRVVSIAKGWAYVAVTAFVLYSLIKASLEKTAQAQSEVIRGYEELAEANEKLATANADLLSHQEQLRHLALHDDLTGLPNRMALYEELEVLLSNPHVQGALLFLDVDNFKYINDSMGHAIGDELLSGIAKRLIERLTGNWQLFRLGGDEYVLLVKDCDKEEILDFALSLHEAMSDPFELTTAVVQVSACTGIAFYPEHGSDSETLVKHADIAMYRAKGKGSNSFVVFDESMKSAVGERLLIDQALRGALKHQELSVLYQPQYEIETQRICGFEALLRWNSPELGSIPPDRFIPLAEQSGLIIPIGTWVLQQACQFIKGLHERGFADLRVSVNVSVVQMRQPDFVDRVLQILKDTKLDPTYLEIEITESMLMESDDRIESKIRDLKSRGIGIALDDFGTGYSSLDYLRKLPITTLKIDKDFIDDLDHPQTGILVAGVIGVGKVMGMYVLAEGVETSEQLKFLASEGCHRFQGYLYSKPIPAHEALSKLEASLVRHQ